MIFLDCDGSTGCEGYGFCNFDEGISGECISCENFPNPEKDCEMNGFNSQGLTQCKTTCPASKKTFFNCLPLIRTLYR